MMQALERSAMTAGVWGAAWLLGWNVCLLVLVGFPARGGWRRSPRLGRYLGGELGLGATLGWSVLFGGGVVWWCRAAGLLSDGGWRYALAVVLGATLLALFNLGRRPALGLGGRMVVAGLLSAGVLGLSGLFWQASWLHVNGDLRVPACAHPQSPPADDNILPKGKP